jgi:hypothetical protein
VLIFQSRGDPESHFRQCRKMAQRAVTRHTSSNRGTPHRFELDTRSPRLPLKLARNKIDVCAHPSLPDSDQADKTAARMADHGMLDPATFSSLCAGSAPVVARVHTAMSGRSPRISLSLNPGYGFVTCRAPPSMEPSHN